MNALRQVTLAAVFVGSLVAIAAFGVRARDGGHAQALAPPAEVTEQPRESLQGAPSTDIRTVQEPAVRTTPEPPPHPAAETPPPRDESALMQQLREMRQSDPELSLRLAREGNEQFPGSPAAAERAAIVVKSLMREGRAAEATAEARAMVEMYPGTPWAADVKRHMLDVPSYLPDASIP